MAVVQGGGQWRSRSGSTAAMSRTRESGGRTTGRTRGRCGRRVESSASTCFLSVSGRRRSTKMDDEEAELGHKEGRRQRGATEPKQPIPVAQQRVLRVQILPSHECFLVAVTSDPALRAIGSHVRHLDRLVLL
ncbi:hypothetical protein EYF80_025562 [Liparis tanakae]|uniref:Uncharacterized protein n=1 Tax=Liparis tanakae TaxID=230148 RepID=A0A4Z2HH13_9TELE|nr:hypothetical protein EYF80_025562 [Liparis tanakae]